MKHSRPNPQLMGFEDSAVFIGASINILPVLLFRNIQTFIYIDNLPNMDGNMEHNFTKTVNGIGFHKMPKGPNAKLHEYTHKSRCTRILYFMNNAFPDKMDPTALEYIRKSAILICCGYVPHKSIFEYMKPGPKYFIGDNITYYLSSWNRDNVCEYIQNGGVLIKEFYRFDIPKSYPYWIPQYVEEHHIVKIPVTKFDSLENMCTNKN